MFRPGRVKPSISYPHQNFVIPCYRPIWLLYQSLWRIRFFFSHARTSSRSPPSRGTIISNYQKFFPVDRQSFFSGSELHEDLKTVPFAVTDGFPLINAQYLGETKSNIPTEVLGKIFTNMKICAENQLDASIGRCCIGIPIYFTDLQRRAVMDAVTIAGLHPLRLMHETTATALAYGIYKTDLPENKQLNVAFVDIGHSSMQVCIAGLKKGQLKILAHSFDQCFGGMDFDKAFFQHLAAKFKTEYKIDVDQEKKASLTDCEEKKKDLSGNTEANLNIKGLMDNKDVTWFLKRDEFEEISMHIFKKALLEAQFRIDSIHAVEVVGSGSRVPAVIKILTEFFGKEPMRILDSSECAVKGCGLECTMLTPSFKVEEFKVQVIFPFPIALTWQGSSHNGNVENQQRAIVFPPIPSVKALTLYTSGTFTVDVQYADVSELQAPLKIN